MGGDARRRVVDEDREAEEADRASPRERAEFDVLHRDAAREVDLEDDELAASVMSEQAKRRREGALSDRRART